MIKTFKPIPNIFEIDNLRYGYAKNSRNIIPELKFQYSHLSYIPLIQFVNTGIKWDTIFNKLEYQMRDIVEFKWDNNIRTIYYYDGGKISLPFHCYFIDSDKQDFFEITIWNLDGSKPIFSKTIKFQTEWYNFILSEESVQEIGLKIKTYIDDLRKFI